MLSELGTDGHGRRSDPSAPMHTHPDACTVVSPPKRPLMCHSILGVAVWGIISQPGIGPTALLPPPRTAAVGSDRPGAAWGAALRGFFRCGLNATALARLAAHPDVASIAEDTHGPKGYPRVRGGVVGSVVTMWWRCLAACCVAGRHSAVSLGS